MFHTIPCFETHGFVWKKVNDMDKISTRIIICSHPNQFKNHYHLNASEKERNLSLQMLQCSDASMRFCQNLYRKVFHSLGSTVLFIQMNGSPAVEYFLQSRDSRGVFLASRLLYLPYAYNLSMCLFPHVSAESHECVTFFSFPTIRQY